MTLVNALVRFVNYLCTAFDTQDNRTDEEKNRDTKALADAMSVIHGGFD